MGKRESFDWVRRNDMQEFRLSPGSKTEIRGFFTNYRVDRDTLPEGWHMYEIMGTDSGCIGNGIIRYSVLANFVGTILTRQIVKMTKHDFRYRNADGLTVDRPYRGVGSYTFGFADGDTDPIDKTIYNKLIKGYKKGAVAINYVKAAVEKYPGLVAWDIELFLEKIGYFKNADEDGKRNWDRYVYGLPARPQRKPVRRAADGKIQAT